MFQNTAHDGCQCTLIKNRPSAGGGQLLSIDIRFGRRLRLQFPSCKKLVHKQTILDTCCRWSCVLTPRALPDRAVAMSTCKISIVVQSQEWRGVFAKRITGTNDIAVPGNARLEEALHVVCHRCRSNTIKQLHIRNDMTATQVHCANVINSLLRFNVSTLAQ